jgi:hypothetical protein
MTYIKNNGIDTNQIVGQSFQSRNVSPLLLLLSFFKRAEMENQKVIGFNNFLFFYSFWWDEQINFKWGRPFLARLATSPSTA